MIWGYLYFWKHPYMGYKYKAIDSIQHTTVSRVSQEPSSPESGKANCNLFGGALLSGLV